MYEQISSNKIKSVFLIAFFVVLVVAVGSVFSYMFDLGIIGPIGAFVLVVAMTGTSYWYSDRIVLSMSRARPVDKATEPYLVNVIEGLSIAAGLPVPKAYVIDDPAPNAFATGRNPDNAAIAVTTGLMEKLDRLELEGVVAHELAHVKNYDTLVQTLAAVMAGTIVLLADWMLRSFFWGGGRKRARWRHRHDRLVSGSWSSRRSSPRSSRWRSLAIGSIWLMRTRLFSHGTRRVLPMRSARYRPIATSCGRRTRPPSRSTSTIRSRISAKARA